MITPKNFFDFSFFNHHCKITVSDAEKKAGLVVSAIPLGYGGPMMAACLGTIILNTVQENRSSSLREKNIIPKSVNELPVFVACSLLYGMGTGLTYKALAELGLGFFAIGLIFFESYNSNNLKSEELLLIRQNADINHQQKENLNLRLLAPSTDHQNIVELLEKLKT